MSFVSFYPNLINPSRPQFEDSAIAIILTKQEKAKKYEKMIAGEELLESWQVSV